MEKKELENLSLMGLYNLKKQIDEELEERYQKANERLSNEANKNEIEKKEQGGEK